MNALTPAGVADRLQIPEARFRRKWRRMMRLDGFPAPLPGVGLRWSAVLVDAWISAGGCPPPAAAKTAPTFVDEAHSSLSARYAA